MPYFLFSLDVPKEQRLQAVRAAILLMPDENREVLQTLLSFLRDVTSLVEENQMTPMNLAVCLGPSLFHLSILKNETLSPRCTYELTNRPMNTPTCKDWIKDAMYLINLGKSEINYYMGSKRNLYPDYMILDSISNQFNSTLFMLHFFFSFLHLLLL